MILVDSSVWIAAWRGKDEKVVSQLTRMIESAEAVINPLIHIELLQGARDIRHQQHLRELLSPIPLKPLEEDVWNEAPKFLLRCREKGVTLTTIDGLIATHAMIGRFDLWSLDTVFSSIPGLRLV